MKPARATDLRAALPAPGQSQAARKRVIARSFDAAAPTYDRHAAIQRRAARALTTRIAGLRLAARPDILEVGCGTGFLSTGLARSFPGARLVLTDLSAAMVARCRAKFARRGIVPLLAVMDGEAPAVPRMFDLVASSFAFQWFLDPPRAAAGLCGCLRDGGRLAFATLGAESLTEWRRAHESLGLAYGGLSFPTALCLEQAILGQARRLGRRLDGGVEEQRFTRRYPSAAAFLEELRSLGADVPAAGAAPLGAGELRRLLRQADGEGRGFRVTYQVLFGSFMVAGDDR